MLENGAGAMLARVSTVTTVNTPPLEIRLAPLALLANTTASLLVDPQPQTVSLAVLELTLLLQLLLALIAARGHFRSKWGVCM
jgi:hypothetical protein